MFCKTFYWCFDCLVCGLCFVVLEKYFVNFQVLQNCFYLKSFYVKTCYAGGIMYCPGCGSQYDNDEQIYCDTCLSARDVNDFLRFCFDRGYPYNAIIGLLETRGLKILLRTLKRRLKALGLKQKANQFGDDYLREVIQEKMQGAGSLTEYPKHLAFIAVEAWLTYKPS